MNAKEEGRGPGMPEPISEARPILEAREVVVLLGGRRRGLLKAALPPVRAVAGVSLSLNAGETLGLVKFPTPPLFPTINGPT